MNTTINNFLFKLPSTPHIASLGGNTFRNDKVLTQNERDEFIQSIEQHWSKTGIVKNTLREEHAR